MEVVEGGKKDSVVIKVENLLDPDFANSLAKFTQVIPVNGKDIFRIKKLHKKLKDALKIYNEARVELAKSCAKKDKNGELELSYNSEGQELVALADDKASEFGRKLKDLKEVEIEITEKFPISSLGANHGLNGRDLANLEFITED